MWLELVGGLFPLLLPELLPIHIVSSSPDSISFLPVILGGNNIRLPAVLCWDRMEEQRSILPHLEPPFVPSGLQIRLMGGYKARSKLGE
jgi:hypothetical protein